LYQAIQTAGIPGVHIRKIAVKNGRKARNAPAELFTTSKEDILTDPVIDVVVEATNDADAAFDIASAALINGKHVVSANKKMIAEHFPELQRIQQKTGKALLYEASVCAAIPIIRTLDAWYRHGSIRSLRAIVNGSCNFILSKLDSGEFGFAEAVKLAQKKGFAETDPAQDVDGFDAASKLQILLAHATGIVTRQRDIVFSSIRQIHAADAELARQNGWRLKQVAQIRKDTAGRYAAWVLPQFVPQTDPLYHIQNEYNGLLVENGISETQFFSGRGAGSNPTASALLHDVLSLQNGYRYQLGEENKHILNSDTELELYCSFPRRKQLPEQLFSSVYEWQLVGERQVITGRIPFHKLAQSNWWRQPEVSLIVLPENETGNLLKSKQPGGELACVAV
ncbi:MAG: homoserine dehydrogenase, partial [Dinghuibacter sp.]|nr:homoserine dehydrogenase [Dinghuibacter sp.]